VIYYCTVTLLTLISPYLGHLRIVYNLLRKSFLSLSLIADSFLGDHTFHDLVVIERGKPKFEPIVKDLKKGARQYFCVDCGNVAAQTALFEIEDAVLVERYCDDCALHQKQS
jgi:hypothetical protein